MNLKKTLSVSVGIAFLSMLGFGLIQADQPTHPLTFYMIGDANGDQVANISDAIFTLHWLYLGGEEPPCQLAADVNGDGDVDLSDPIVQLRHMFVGQSTVPPLYGVCSVHSTVGATLTCEVPSSCPGIPSTGQ